MSNVRIRLAASVLALALGVIAAVVALVVVHSVLA